VPIDFAARLAAAVAARLQIREPRRLTEVFGTVPAPGPRAPAESIEQAGSGHIGSAAPAVSRRGRPRRHTNAGHERAQRSHAPGTGTSAGAAQHLPSTTNGTATAVHEETGWGAPESTATPAVPAPAVDPATGAVQLGAVSGEQPRPHQVRPATQRNDDARATRSRPAPIPDADFEQAMRRVLDDAARRHGIEV
jgi:hypothetical protein